MCLQPPQLGTVKFVRKAASVHSQCEYYSIWHVGPRPSHGISATLRVRRAAALLLLLLTEAWMLDLPGRLTRLPCL